MILLICGIAFLLYSQIAGAVSLEISGHAAGQGYQNLSFSGDLLNVSLWQNGTAWNITAMGAGA